MIITPKLLEGQLLENVVKLRKYLLVTDLPSATEDNLIGKLYKLNDIDLNAGDTYTGLEFDGFDEVSEISVDTNTIISYDIALNHQSDFYVNTDPYVGENTHQEIGQEGTGGYQSRENQTMEGNLG